MSNSPFLRAAIIGTGRIASLLERDPFRGKPHTHAAWYASRPDIRLVAGADTDAERLAQFGADWSIDPAHLYTDYREMLARERPDLVSICAYAPDRVVMALDAIDAGARGLWLEKAVACSVAEGERLMERVRAAGISVVVNHPRSQEAGYRRVREIVKDGSLGRLESVHALFSGQFIHTGTHAWEVLDGWCGPWAELRCWPDETGLADADGPRHDVGGRAHILFESGVQAFVSGGAKDYFIFQFDLIFTAGRIQLGNEVARLVRTAPSRRYEGFIELADEGEPLHGGGGPPLVDLLASAVRNGSPTIASLEAAIRALSLGIAILQAGERPGEPVTPDRLRHELYVASV
ncbi:MAG TPA: Gfo/Idh/MocA family oxidoreductase [Vicinamibacterales bacterium]